jgi:arsenate reductase-like glutaredoxin family protein
MAFVATKSSYSIIDIKELNCSKETFYAWIQQSSLVV